MTIDPPPVIRAAWVNRSAEDAFRIFTQEIGAWWPLPTHGIFGDRSGGVIFRDGKLIEFAVDGTEAVWGEVAVWDPPTRLVIAWHPGRDIAEASEVEVSFEAGTDATGTRVVVEHRGWDVFGEDAAARRLGYVGPNAWGYVLDHFADGAEVSPDAVDIAALTEAYEEFFAEAERGDFGEPADGGWNAEQVVAHVALNDAAMLATCQAIVHGNPTSFANEVCQDPAVLRGHVEHAGTMANLIAQGRATATAVLSAVQRLSPEQQRVEVPCRLLHDGAVVAERDIAWVSLAVDTQAAMHLPAHVEQLRNLRA